MSTFTGTPNPTGSSTSTSIGTPTDGKNGTMNATTTEAGTTRRPHLSGMTWLVWRQHRAAFWTILGLTVLAVAWMVYQRGQMTDLLDSHNYPAKSITDIGEAFWPYTDALSTASTAVMALPVLLGVFIGAPLLAGDLENGTAKLVAAQSMSRTRWLATKLALTGLVVLVSTVALSAVFGWWWTPVKRDGTVLDWTTSAFDTTGPVPVALTLISVFGGVAIGVVLRRTLMAMVVTFGFTIVVQIIWSHFRLSLGNIVTVTTDKGVGENDPYPSIPDASYQLDQSFLTGRGDLLGWGTCSNAEEAAQDACLRKADVVGWSVDYLPMSQMNGMQWFGASVVFALTAAVVAFLFFWGRKRLV